MPRSSMLSMPRYTSFADPVAEKSEKLVKVIAAGLHPIVKSLANGTHYGSTEVLPFIPGVDGGTAAGRHAGLFRICASSVRHFFGTRGGAGLDLLATARRAG